MNMAMTIEACREEVLKAQKAKDEAAERYAMSPSEMRFNELSRAWDRVYEAKKALKRR